MIEDRLPAPWPCPLCNGPLVWAAAFVYPNAMPALVCEQEEDVYQAPEGL